MFKGKRGLEYTLYYSIWQIIALLMVIIIILVALRGIANNTTYWKKYYSTDLGLIADIENINQGDFVMKYALMEKIDIPLIFKDMRFTTYLNKDHIAITDSNRPELKTTYPFAKGKNINVVENNVVSEFIVLSKIKSELTIGTYLPSASEDAKDSCPTVDTAKPRDMANISIITLSQELNTQKPSLEVVFKDFGKNPLSKPELTIMLHYKKDNNFTIYYSNDKNEIPGQKFACILGKEYADKYIANYDIKRYDGFLDNDAAFQNFLKNKHSDEYWIILSESDIEKAINANDFAILIKDAMLEHIK